MALNELLIISIQTRLKGSLLIGHRKQEPLLVLHNCPLLEVHGTGVRGVTLSGMGWPSRGPCPPPGFCVPTWGVRPCRAVHARLGLCMLIGSRCTHERLCTPIWGCACLFGAVCALLGLCVPI